MYLNDTKGLADRYSSGEGERCAAVMTVSCGVKVVEWNGMSNSSQFRKRVYLTSASSAQCQLIESTKAHRI